MKKKHTTALYILIGCILVQLCFILFKDYTGYVPIRSFLHFMVMWSTSSLISAIFVGLLWIINLGVINVLERWITWQHRGWIRFIIEAFVALFIGIMVGCLLTIMAEVLFDYKESLSEVLLYNAIITGIANLILIAIRESVMQYKNHQNSLIRAEKLERENVDMRFETLKKQLDPHFLFNSLNVLSLLIRKNPVKAQQFIEEFSSVYRYALEVIDQPIVTVRQELDFVQSYIFLQKIRFENSIHLCVDIPAHVEDLYIPPLAVQILLENALKHNIATETNPLSLKIYAAQDMLFVSNTLQRKKRNVYGKRMGQENLKSRYHLISDREPKIIETETEYIVQLPLIEPE